MKREPVFVAAALGIGLLTWLADATVDCLVFHEGTFWDILYSAVPPGELYTRAVTLVSFLAFGFVLSVYAGRRGRAEEALRRSEERLRRTVETMAEGVVVVDGNGMIVQTNPAAQQILGLPPRGIEQRHYTSPDFEMLRPDGTPMPPEEMAGPRAFREGRTVRNVVMGAKRPDGSLRWVDVSAAPLMTEEGTAEGVVVTFADVTERKEAEEALRQSEERFRVLVETAWEGISVCEYDPATDRCRLIFCNDRFVEMSGYAREKLEEAEDLNCLGKAHMTREQLAAEAERKRKGLPRRGLASWVRPDGKENYYEFSAVPMPVGDRHLVMGVDRDVTERVQAERALRRSVERYKELADSIADVFFAMDRELCCTYWNKASEVLTGIPAEEAIGKSLYELFPDMAGTPAEQAYRKAIETQEPQSFLDRYRARDRDLVFDVSAYPSAEGLSVFVRDVTERKRMEEGLRQSEERLRTVFAAAKNVAFVTTDLGGGEARILDFSPGAEAIFGYRREEVIGRPLAILHTPEQVENFASVTDTIRRGKTGLTVELELVRKSGQHFPAILTTFPIFDDDGNLVKILGVSIDITERKEAEVALRNSEREKAAILDSMSELLLYQDGDGKILWANRAAAESAGLSPEDLVGRHCYQVWHGRESRCPACPVARAMDTGRPEEAEMATPEGRTWQIRGDPVRDENGNIVGIVEAALDITERRRARKAVQKEKQRLRRYLDIAGVVFVVLDADGTVSLLNRKGCELLGYEEEQIIGRNMFETLVPDRMRQKVKAVFDKLIAGEIERAEYYENPWLTKSGEERLLLWHNTVIRDEEDNITGTLSSGEDITDRRRIEAKLRREEEALQRAARLESVGKLAGGIAHDFNNLMTGIMGYSKLLLDDLSAADPHREDVQEIQNAAGRAAALTQQLLAFSRKQILQPRLLDLNAVVNGTVRMLGRLIGENIEPVTALDPDVGQARADPTQIEQVILNLAVNARDAMPTGGTLKIGTANVELDDAFAEAHPPTRPGHYVMLTVTDTGCGMDQETQEHLFEPFFTTKAPGEGTGLGLSTAYGIVKQHDGYIWAESAPGKGTTFRIYLPRLPAEAKSPEAETPAVAPEAGSGVILAVEDEESVRRLVHRVLSDNGYTVLTVGSADEAEHVMARHGDEIALLLTDVVLPDRSGPELRAKLTEERPALKALYMSGYAGDRLAQRRTLESGVPFLAKPFSPDALLQAVRQALDQP